MELSITAPAAVLASHSQALKQRLNVENKNQQNNVLN